MLGPWIQCLKKAFLGGKKGRKSISRKPCRAIFGLEQLEDRLAPALPIHLSIDDVSKPEKGSFTFTGEPETGPFTFTITADQAASQDITVMVDTVDDTAKATDGDYTRILRGKATIPAGSTTTQVTVSIGHDSIVEEDETFFVNLTDPRLAGVPDSSKLVIEDGQGKGTIENNDKTFLSFEEIQVGKEEDEAFTFTITSDQAASQDITIVVNTKDGIRNNNGGEPAKASDGDYTPINGQVVTIPAGSTTATFTVNVVDDSKVEDVEHFLVDLSDARFNGKTDPTRVDVWNSFTMYGRIFNNDILSAVDAFQTVFAARKNYVNEKPTIDVHKAYEPGTLVAQTGRTTATATLTSEYSEEKGTYSGKATIDISLFNQPILDPTAAGVDFGVNVGLASTHAGTFTVNYTMDKDIVLDISGISVIGSGTFSFNKGKNSSLPISTIQMEGRFYEGLDRDNSLWYPYYDDSSLKYKLWSVNEVSRKVILDWKFTVTTTDIQPSIPSLNIIDGGLDFGYKVKYAPVAKDTYLKAFWSIDKNLSRMSEGPILNPVTGEKTFKIPAGTNPGTYNSLHLPSSALQNRPWWGDYLIVVTNQDNQVEESNYINNTVPFALPDIVAKTLTWHTDSNEGGGIDLSYEILGRDLPTNPTISVYWANSTTFNPATDKLAYTFQGEKNVGLHILNGGSFHQSGLPGGHITAEQLSTISMPDSKTPYLLLVVDPPSPYLEPNQPNHGTFFEGKENNNVVPLWAGKEAIFGASETFKKSLLVNPNADKVGHIVALFRPAAGALTLKQAAAILGVDHFNWIQELSLDNVPVSMEIWRDVRFIGDSMRGQMDVQRHPISGKWYHGFKNVSDLELFGEEVKREKFDGLDPLQQKAVPPRFDTFVFLNKNGDVLFNDLGDPASVRQPWADEAVFYFNEGEKVEGRPSEGIGLKDLTSTFDLGWFDRPSLHPSHMGNGYLEFKTRLAGVKTTGEKEVWSGLGPGFRWTSNAKHKQTENSLLGYLKPSPDDLPPIISGGILQVQYENEAPNNAPQISSINEKLIVQGETVTLDLFSMDPDPGQSITFTLNSAPEGSYIDPQTGKFTWTPSATQGPGTYPVTVRVTDNGTPALSATQTFQIKIVGANTPPTATVSLDNSSPGTNSILVATATSSDAEGDTVTLGYVWKKNGQVLVGQTSNTLDLSVVGHGDKGDEITVEVTPNDGTDNGEPARATATVVNTVPTATVSLAPTAPLTGDVLTATATGSDLDGDLVSFGFVWKKNGQVLEGQTASMLDLGLPGNGDKGDEITVEATPSDGTSNGVAAAAVVTVFEAPLLGAQTTIQAKSVTLGFRARNQKVTLGATVQSEARGIRGGTVTFTVRDDSGQVVGNPVTSKPLARGKASALFTLPGGTPQGTYHILAAYSGTANFSASSNEAALLTLTRAKTTVRASKVKVTFSPSEQSLVFTAKVASGAGVVEGGTITFTVRDARGTIIGEPVVSDPVTKGSGSARFTLPGGITGRFKVSATYSGNTNFLPSATASAFVVAQLQWGI